MPFLYGLEMSGLINTQINLSRDIPSECARKLLNNEIDVGLIPVAVIPQLKESYIISDFCIGANGAVNSVMLYSEVPLEKIVKIYLDYQSRTSVQLVKILAKEFWKIKPEFIAAEKGFENNISGTTAAVVIGDRTFELNKKFTYVFDLAEEWKKMTGLPFVFACWVANKKIDDEFQKQFNAALKHGINNIEKSIAHYHLQEKYSTNVLEYLKKYIQYNFGETQKSALKTFLFKI
ncbi:MAG: chorismate dehydratase [Bacteroidia bacterium]|nr:MAG: chorismate dehydratase [Bacteroidia bacterium]